MIKEYTHIALKYLKGKGLQESDAMCVINSTFEKILLLKKIDCSKEYFLKSISNKMKDFYKKRDFEKKIFVSFNEEHSIDPLSLEDRFIHKEEVKALIDKIKSISNVVHKKIVWMYFVEQKEYSEIVEDTYFHYGNIRKIIHNFRREVKASFNP